MLNHHLSADPDPEPAYGPLLRIPYTFIAQGILTISLVRACAATLSFGAVWMCLAFGVLGRLTMRFAIPRASLVPAVVLAPFKETSLRQMPLLSFESPTNFVERPIAAVLSVAVLFVLVFPMIRLIGRR